MTAQKRKTVRLSGENFRKTHVAENEEGQIRYPKLKRMVRKGKAIRQVTGAK